MKRFISMTAAGLGLAALTGPALASEYWACDIALGTAERGQMAFISDGGRIAGEMETGRGRGERTSEIRGSWRGDRIEFRRIDGGREAFVGLVLDVDEAAGRRGVPDDYHQVVMAGRYGLLYQGSWTAECRRSRPGLLDLFDLPDEIPDIFTPPVDDIPPPRTYSTGPMEVPQTYMADLDDGDVGGREGADFWFRARTATERYLEPVNGARLAVFGRSAPHRDECAEMRLSESPIPIGRVGEGSYVCALTDEGRYSVFRINQPIGRSPGTIHMGYTTWERF